MERLLMVFEVAAFLRCLLGLCVSRFNEGDVITLFESASLSLLLLFSDV